MFLENEKVLHRISTFRSVVKTRSASTHSSWDMQIGAEQTIVENK